MENKAKKDKHLSPEKLQPVGERVDVSSEQKKRLRGKNAFVCCVCKERDIGDNFHHIDGDSSNTVDENLAVLCVRHHDHHHRPQTYNHMDLGADSIREAKKNWEAFVAEAKQPNPKVLAAVNIYGTENKVDSMKLVFQWDDGRIEFERLYHSHTGPIDKWVDLALGEVAWLGKNIKVVIIDAPLYIEFCPHCEQSLSNTVDENWAKKLNATTWDKESICSIYINPKTPSIAILISFRDEVLYQGHLHLCKSHLHYMDSKHAYHISIQKSHSIRTQATNLVAEILSDWEPGCMMIGTGNPDNPSLVNYLELPRCWKRSAKHSRNKNH